MINGATKDTFSGLKSKKKKGIWKWQKSFTLRLEKSVLGTSIYHYVLSPNFTANVKMN